MGQHSLGTISHSLKILCGGSNKACTATKYDTEEETLALEAL